MKLLKQTDCKITAQQFDNDCEISFSIRKANSEACEEKLKKFQDLNSIRISLEAIHLKGLIRGIKSIP